MYRIRYSWGCLFVAPCIARDIDWSGGLAIAVRKNSIQVGLVYCTLYRIVHKGWYLYYAKSKSTGWVILEKYSTG